MKKMKSKEFKRLMQEFDTQAPSLDELSGDERVAAWIEWLKVRLNCPTIEQLETRLGMTIYAPETPDAVREEAHERICHVLLMLDEDRPLYEKAAKDAGQHFAYFAASMILGYLESDTPFLKLNEED